MEPKVVQVVVVVVTNLRFILIAIFSITLLNNVNAAVVPEDRTDILYHSYEGGGLTVDGPSILVRKGDKKNFSIFGQYYVDSITSATIDVEVSGSSQYTEERTETGFGVDYVRDKTTLSFSFSNSSENDYEADSYNIGVSQDMFGDLTTISLGYSQGDDIIRNSTISPALFEKEADRKNYRLGLTQVLTKDLIMSFAHETITNEGYLQNPYRFTRYVVDPNAAVLTYQLGAEEYPDTRTSTANAIRAKYFLPYRAALHFEYRVFEDDWGIDATQTDFGYTHPIGDHWIIEAHIRNYEQTAADFYFDLLPFNPVNGGPNFYGRDKELSTYTTTTFGFGVTYEFAKNGWGFIDKGSVNFFYDSIQFDYSDFRDLRATGFLVGEEPLYSFDAEVIRLFVSLWY